MFGFKTVRKGFLESLQTKIDRLETEVKGYYENTGELNEYFRAIEPLMQGFSVRDQYLDMKRLNIQRCYEGCAPAYGVINKIAKAVGDIFPYLELQDRATGEFIEKHPVMALLARPNDRYNTVRFGRAWATNYLAYGDSFVYCPAAVGKNLGERAEMYQLPGFRIEGKRGGYERPFEGITVVGGGRDKKVITTDDGDDMTIEIKRS